MDRAREALSRSAVDQSRARAGKKAATDIWLWGQGARNNPARHTASTVWIDRLGGSPPSIWFRGSAFLAGLTVRKVNGATGYLGTNYAGKIAAAAEARQVRISFLACRSAR